MTTTEFLKSLTLEQADAFVVLRDDLMAANSNALVDATAAVNAERDKLTEQLATKDAELSAATDYIARVGKVKEAIQAAIADPAVDTDAAVTAIIAEAEKPEVERHAAELEAQIAALTAQRNALVKPVEATPNDRPAQ